MVSVSGSLKGRRLSGRGISSRNGWFGGFSPAVFSLPLHWDDQSKGRIVVVVQPMIPGWLAA